jgi:hypothetical protein
MWPIDACAAFSYNTPQILHSAGAWLSLARLLAARIEVNFWIMPYQKLAECQWPGLYSSAYRDHSPLHRRLAFSNFAPLWLTQTEGERLDGATWR